MKLALHFFRTCILAGGIIYLADANHIKSPFHALIGFEVLLFYQVMPKTKEGAEDKSRSLKHDGR